MEANRKYVVKEVKKEGDVTCVRLVSQGSPLLLEKEIPPCFLPHMVRALMRRGNESEETCNNLCTVLMNVNLDDEYSRK